MPKRTWSDEQLELLAHLVSKGKGAKQIHSEGHELLEGKTEPQIRKRMSRAGLVADPVAAKRVRARRRLSPKESADLDQFVLANSHLLSTATMARKKGVSRGTISARKRKLKVKVPRDLSLSLSGQTRILAGDRLVNFHIALLMNPDELNSVMAEQFGVSEKTVTYHRRIVGTIIPGKRLDDETASNLRSYLKKFAEFLTVAEIAKVWEIHEGTVRKHMRKAKVRVPRSTALARPKVKRNAVIARRRRAVKERRLQEKGIKAEMNGARRNGKTPEMEFRSCKQCNSNWPLESTYFSKYRGGNFRGICRACDVEALLEKAEKALEEALDA